MQGLNVNLDSTYIPETIRDTQSVKEFERDNSQLSFVSMLNKEIQMKEIPEAKDANVSKTDMDVSKSSSESNAEQGEKVAFADTDVKKNQDHQNKDQIESEKKAPVKTEVPAKAERTSDKTDEAEKRLSRIRMLKNMNDNEKLNKIIKDSKGSELDYNSHKVQLVSKKSEDTDLEIIIENFDKLKKSTGEKDSDELLTAQTLAVQSVKDFSSAVKEVSKKNSDGKIDIKEIKNKKDVKKLSDVISVTDLRTEKKDAAVSVKKTDFVTSIKQTSNDSAQVTMDLNSLAQKNILSLDAQSAGAQGSTFQAMLENQITENAADFVKAGNIVLKDNNVGNINLILHPESLGNVKISLELSDKVITGKILVSSQEAFNAFNSTQNSLKAAFIESGFDAANFDIAYANQGNQFAENHRQDNGQNEKQAMNIYNNFVSENYSVAENYSDSLNDVRDYSINIVA
ncbi:MAG: flagellar hook-length control protein FliK [Treponema sp.]|nr:flagellar hook-length control protein FliK [Treponema sp.]